MAAFDYAYRFAQHSTVVDERMLGSTGMSNSISPISCTDHLDLANNNNTLNSNFSTGGTRGGGSEGSGSPCSGYLSLSTSSKQHSMRKKPHSCDQCTSAFGSKMELEEHQNSHTGHKPFECDICGARFNRRSTLWNHKRIHSDTKPFSCQICGIKFKWKNSLKCHREMHIRKNETSANEIDIVVDEHSYQEKAAAASYSSNKPLRKGNRQTQRAKSSTKGNSFEEDDDINAANLMSEQRQADEESLSAGVLLDRCISAGGPDLLNYMLQPQMEASSKSLASVGSSILQAALQAASLPLSLQSSSTANCPGASRVIMPSSVLSAELSSCGCVTSVQPSVICSTISHAGGPAVESDVCSGLNRSLYSPHLQHAPLAKTETAAIDNDCIVKIVSSSKLPHIHDKAAVLPLHAQHCRTAAEFDAVAATSVTSSAASYYSSGLHLPTVVMHNGNANSLHRASAGQHVPIAPLQLHQQQHPLQQRVYDSPYPLIATSDYMPNVDVMLLTTSAPSHLHTVAQQQLEGGYVVRELQYNEW